MSLQFMAGRHNVFSNNPLIPSKRDKVTNEVLLDIVSSGDSFILPVSEGRPLVLSVKQNEEIKWELAWQPLSNLGLASQSQIKSKEWIPLYDQLVYLGEKASCSYFGANAQTLKKLMSGENSASAENTLIEFFRKLSGQNVAFIDVRTLMVASDWLQEEDMQKVAIAGNARAILEWHKQNQFCGKCGEGTVSVEAGNRRQCTSCKNKAYPRTDPVVIHLIIDKKNDKVLLGRQLRAVPNMWSCLAGFMEPGESLEEAVRRETREEVGIELGEIFYHSSQPWPVGVGNMSSQLMIGFFAFATTFDLTVDKRELQDAKWFTREEVKEAFQFKSYKETQKTALLKVFEVCEDPSVDPKWTSLIGASGKMFVPGPYAIAHNLIKTWIESGSDSLVSLL